MTDTTIFIVDDDPAMQDSLSWLIETIGYPVKTYASAQDYLDDYDASVPGCMILDVRLPGMSGLQLQKKMKELDIRIPIIIISGHGDVPMAVKAMQQGAQVFLEKPFRDQDLLDNIQEALELDRKQRENQAATALVSQCVEALTPREREVMQLMVAGKSSREIGEQCGISIKTVEVHRSRVMDKMQAGSLPELVQMVLSLQQASAA